jgi:hypothetical protein
MIKNAFGCDLRNEVNIVSVVWDVAFLITSLTDRLRVVLWYYQLNIPITCLGSVMYNMSHC